MLRIWKDGVCTTSGKVVEKVEKIMEQFGINTNRDVELFGNINDEDYYFQIIDNGSRETLLVYDDHKYITDEKEISAWEDENC